MHVQLSDVQVRQNGMAKSTALYYFFTQIFFFFMKNVHIGT